ncbi:hypothetical protein GCM10023088_07970 [Actinomadura verrucosospora]|uniref:relaxase/mobilization nuclease domain-containing protein n=1 Tax=Actinomadura verrucosospora TaxID=46165 RepID=UPI0031ED04AE
MGLLRYLYGPGRHEEHRDPHVVAGFRSAPELEPGVRADGSRDFRRLDALFTQPLALLGERNYRQPVWHLPLRAAPEDPVMSDQQWARIAHEVMDRVGLAPAGDFGAVRWVAVRHAADHVHIVATLARQDGGRPDVWNDGYRVRDACRAIERQYGLRRTAPADRTAARRPSRGEIEKAVRHGRPLPSRTLLRRKVQTAAAGASSEAEFFRQLRDEGVLVRQRFSERTAGEMTGYAVALPDDLNSDGRPVWFGGGKLAADLTLPKLRRRWTGADGSVHASSPLRPLDGRHLSERTRRAVLRTAVRRAADESATTNEFLDRLRGEGLLVKLRYSQTVDGQITGYAVAFAAEHDGHEPTWYPGSRLADDLSLSRLRQRWASPAAYRQSAAGQDELTPEERQAFYDDAARAAAFATAQIRRHLVTNPHAAQDACWAASDALHVAARVTGNRHLHRAADAYDRAARAPCGRIPTPTPAGNALRTTARLLALTGTAKDRTVVSTMLLVANFISLLDTIAQLHSLQERHAQADAARRAAAHTREARPAGGAPSPPPAGPSAQARLAMAAFPTAWAPLPQDAQSRSAPSAPTGPARSGRRRP